jgi:hypothetical protein
MNHVFGSQLQVKCRLGMRGAQRLPRNPPLARRSEQAVIFTNGAKTDQGSLVSSRSSAIALKVWACVPRDVKSGPIRGQ